MAGLLRRRAFLAASLLLVLAVNAPALLQLARTGGPVFCPNADAEPIYLQYGTSLATQSLFSRTGQFPVTAMHLAGLSGGWINLLWDLTLPLAFLLLVRSLGRALDLGEGRSALLAFLAALGPALVTACNPAVQALFDWHLASGAVRWLTVPGGAFLPIARTPEPQFTLVVLAAAVRLGLARRSFLPVYAALPFLYPFVAVPTAFVALALHLGRPAVAWLAVSAGCAVVFALTAGPEARALTVETRLPFVSFTSALALALWLALRRGMREDLRRPALLLALAPLAAQNVHVLSGRLAVPANFEQYAGAECVPLILALGVGRPAVAAAALAGAALLWLPGVASQARWSATMPVPDARMLEALRTEPERVAVRDRGLVRVLAMVHPRQGLTALDPWQTWRFYVPLGGAPAQEGFERYLDARAEILRDPRRAAEFRHLLRFLDEGYAHGQEDFVLYHAGRKERFTTDVDVAAEAARRPPRPARLRFGRVTPEGTLTVDGD